MRDWHAGGEARDRFVTDMGDALKDIGFFALTGHGISAEDIDQAYATIGRFFHLDDAKKRTYERA
ncbi:MAG: 2-oxoglutarate and iron-dependent oxygenase domain-containing protein, partial [Candidatus Poseidoniaceae archaeon]